MLNRKQTAYDLRVEAKRLKEEIERLLEAADVLDPEPTLKNLDLPPATRQPFSAVLTEMRKPLSLADAAKEVLIRIGAPMDRVDLFKEVQLLSRGKSLESFCSILSREKEIFASAGRGKWDLRNRLAHAGVESGEQAA